MTTKPPPLHYFAGIAFNSGYYTIIDEAPLTESKADSRYLIKTQTDVRIQTRLRRKLHHSLPSTSYFYPNKSDTSNSQ